MAGGPVLQGRDNSDDATPRPIGAAADGNDWRLMVDALLSGVSEVNLDYTNDEVTVANTSDGGTTRALAKGDTSGRFQIDVERIGNVAPSMDGGRQQVNATLQVSDSDSPGGAGVVTASTPRTTLASDDPAVTALQIIDDWDETDRAKVNPIVGSAGVQGASGVVTASTQRVTVATDDKVSTALDIIDDWDESDRAKVNPIVGSAGVQGGSGTVSPSTQRVVLATDVALPTGTNTIGKLASNDGVDVGDVTVNNAGGASAVNIQDGGNIITVDTAQLPAALVGGRLDVNNGAWLGSTAPTVGQKAMASSIPVVIASDQSNVPVSQATASALNAQVVGSVADGSPVSGNPVQIAGGDGANVQLIRTDTTGNQGVYAKSASTALADAASNTQLLPTSEAGTVLGQVVFPRVFNGSTWDLVRGTTTGSNTIGGVAYGSLDTAANFPVKGGSLARNFSATATASDDTDVNNLISDRVGSLFTIGGSPRTLTATGRRLDADGAANDEVLVAVGASEFAVITRITISVDEACTAGIQVSVGTGTLIATGATVAVYHPGIVPGGFLPVGDGSGIIHRGAAGDDIVFDCEDPVGGSVNITVTYYLVPSS